MTEITEEMLDLALARWNNFRGRGANGKAKMRAALAAALPLVAAQLREECAKVARDFEIGGKDAYATQLGIVVAIRALGDSQPRKDGV